ncbi:MAG: hypothetical protein K6B44_04330 [Lachnospiraceae bacterium]|nr:hypothetical protein [Lachnospiraceae bacterium]
MDETNDKKHIVIKLIFILAAVAFIIVAAVIAAQREKQNAPVAEETDKEVDTTDEENALVFSLVPSMPDTVSYNGMYRSDCEAAVKEGSMILLKSSNGASVYINNYRDDEVLKAAVKTEDDFKAWLYDGYAVFDVDEKHVQALYKKDLENLAEYIKGYEGISLPQYFTESGTTTDEFLSGRMQTAYHYVADLEMTEAMLTDTIGDVTETEIAEMAEAEGYESTDALIEQYGRDSILYYLRPQKILQYIDQRLEELK